MDSFFTVSKVLWFLAAPSNALVLTGGLGVLLCLVRLRRLGGALVVVSVIGLAVFGFSPAANYIFAPLEDRFPQFVDDGRPVAGVIVLGGAEVPDVGLARKVPAFGDAAERAIAFGALARRYPEARLAFVGGSSALFPSGPVQEAEMMRLTLPDLGIPLDRVEFEDKSRNTAENAAFAKALLKPKPGERWLLITSAFHMPRAVGCFRKAGFDVVAYPVDYRTVGSHDLNSLFPFATFGLSLTDVGVKEWIGLVAYYASGKTSALFPAP